MMLIVEISKGVYECCRSRRVPRIAWRPRTESRNPESEMLLEFSEAMSLIVIDEYKSDKMCGVYRTA